MGINEYFDKIYCINLDRRVDRWEENCLPQFEKIGLDVERFSAVDGKELNLPQGSVYSAELAGSYSHLNALKKAKEDKVKKLLLLEDDVFFKENVNELFESLIERVPNDWDYLFFGGNHVGGYLPITDGVVKINRSYAIHACGIKESSYDIMIQHLENKINKVMSDLTITHKPSVAADYFLGDLHRVLNTYCFLPHLAWQKDGHSDIQGAYMDYNFLKK
jgi:GR25 family glycosyltransferase involved in LPS biosynthesis